MVSRAGKKSTAIATILRGGTTLVESCYHLLSEWQQSCDSGSTRSVAMLSFSQGEVWADRSVQQFFKHFGGQTQDGDRMVGGALIFGFSPI